MDQYGRVRVNRFQIAQALGLELIVNNTGTVPQQYVGTGFPLHITAEVLVRRPQNFLPERVKIIDNFQRDTRGYNPVRTSLDRRRGADSLQFGQLIAWQLCFYKMPGRVSLKS